MKKYLVTMRVVVEVEANDEESARIGAVENISLFDTVEICNVEENDGTGNG